MHQDIQNFSQIMDINTNDKLVINYELKIHRSIIYKFYINNIPISKIKGEIFFNLDDIINFNFKNISGDGAIEIIMIAINGIEILPTYLNRANPPTNWIENIEKWSFSLDKPFYSYIQEITGHGEIF